MSVLLWAQKTPSAIQAEGVSGKEERGERMFYTAGDLVTGAAL